MINDEEVRHVLQAICTEMAQIRQILERTFPEPLPKLVDVTERAFETDEVLLTKIIKSAKYVAADVAAAEASLVSVPAVASDVVIGEFTYKPLESQ